MSLTIEMVDDLEKFEAMQGEWNELVESMTCPEVFSSCGSGTFTISATIGRATT